MRKGDFGVSINEKSSYWLLKRVSSLIATVSRSV